MLKVNKKIKYFGHTNGMDCLEDCFNKKHFNSYKKQISYQYNSYGFRDEEWPTDLSDVIWCVGDSFTVGIGQPYNETWPKVLERKIRKRCLNLGEDGCSNDTITQRVQEIYKLYKPQLIIIMWSYFHRRNIHGKNVHSDKNDFGLDKDLYNFVKNFKIVNSLPVDVINLVVPNASSFDNKDHLVYFLKKNKIENLLIFDQLDYARDYHHFDIKTSEYISNLIIEKIKDLDIESKYIL